MASERLEDAIEFRRQQFFAFTVYLSVFFLNNYLLFVRRCNARARDIKKVVSLKRGEFYGAIFQSGNSFPVRNGIIYPQVSSVFSHFLLSRTKSISRK